MTLTPALFDLRDLQIVSLANDLTLYNILLDSMPEQWHHPDSRFILAAFPKWAKTQAASLLLSRLRNRTKIFTLLPELADMIITEYIPNLSHCEIWAPCLLSNSWKRSHPLVDPDHISQKTDMRVPTRSRHRLAYFSPLPPQQSGISYYSEFLILELSQFFDIDVIGEPNTTPLPKGARSVISFPDYRQNLGRYDLQLYQTGNSSHHLRSLAELEENSGVIVLHDFYLSHAFCDPAADTVLGTEICERLYRSHGYLAVESWCKDQQIGSDKTIWHFPVNLRVLQNATAVIVHSNEPVRQACQFYGANAAESWSIIPHLKQLNPVSLKDRQVNKKQLGYSESAYIIASFGFIGIAKRSICILEAFMNSTLALRPECSLVFVGECPDNILKQRLLSLVSKAKDNGTLAAEVRITGWVDSKNYSSYLAAVDCAVQLRTLSRGETSGAVLDCMSFGVPIIINDHGSFSDIPEECALKLPDIFSKQDLTKALERYYNDKSLTDSYVTAALQYLSKENAPAHCAHLYAQTIRRAISKQRSEQFVIDYISENVTKDRSIKHIDEKVANAMALLFPSKPRLRQLFIDVSAIARNDLGSGVQRVTRSLCLNFLQRPPQGFRVEPVEANSDGLGYNYARSYTLNLIGIGQQVSSESIGSDNEPVDYAPGDIFLGLDLDQHVVIQQDIFYQYLRAQGVDVRFVVHDLLPCKLPLCFPPGASELHRQWLSVITKADGALCVTRAVANELREWMMENMHPQFQKAFKIDTFHHGCDFLQHMTPTSVSKQSSSELNAKLMDTEEPILLMVGTVEPRKGYLDMIRASTLLWQRGEMFKLVIVGREGWTDLPKSERRTIPQTVEAICKHPLFAKKLFWRKDACDLELSSLYNLADGFISASYGEGFGIPLVEAASLGLPLLARDIPVFREVTSSGAHYFPKDADDNMLVESLSEFLSAIRVKNKVENNSKIKCQTWDQSADQILKVLDLTPSNSFICQKEIPHKSSVSESRSQKSKWSAYYTVKIAKSKLPYRSLKGKTKDLLKSMSVYRLGKKLLWILAGRCRNLQIVKKPSPAVLELTCRGRVFYRKINNSRSAGPNQL